MKQTSERFLAAAHEHMENTPLRAHMDGLGQLLPLGRDAAMEQLLDVNQAAWEAELAMIEEHYDAVGERLPVELRRQLDDLRDRLQA